MNLATVEIRQWENGIIKGLPDSIMASDEAWSLWRRFPRLGDKEGKPHWFMLNGKWRALYVTRDRILEVSREYGTKECDYCDGKGVKGESARQINASTKEPRQSA